METYYIAQKFWSLWSAFKVTDGAGKTVYSVESELSMTKKLGVFNSAHQQVGEIRKAMISLTPKYELYEYGHKVGEIHKDITLFRPKYTISLNHWTAQGDLTGWNYTIYNAQHQEVGKVRKELLHLTDHYAISFANPQDALSMVLLALAIDAVNEADSQTSSSDDNEKKKNG